MKVHVSVDSGGSKIKAVLYDDAFRLIGHASTGSIRGNSTPKELCERNLRDLLSQLFDGRDDLDLGKLHGVADQEIINAIQARFPNLTLAYNSEGQVGIAAAGISGDGLLCLSGTGSSMFYIRKDGTRAGGMGGYGAVIFDEGSGYHIGRMACAAAIRYFEGRGEPTVLYDSISEHFGNPRFTAALFSIYNNPDRAPIASVASLAPVVSRAAYHGDAAALRILEHAGECLGDQMNALIRRHQIPESVPMTVSGGTYKGHSALYRSLCRGVRRESPTRPLLPPLFEPVVGGVLCHWFSLGRAFDDAAREHFTREFSNYIYSIGEDPTC